MKIGTKQQNGWFKEVFPILSNKPKAILMWKFNEKKVITYWNWKSLRTIIGILKSLGLNNQTLDFLVSIREEDLTKKRQPMLDDAPKSANCNKLKRTHCRIKYNGVQTAKCRRTGLEVKQTLV